MKVKKIKYNMLKILQYWYQFPIYERRKLPTREEVYENLKAVRANTFIPSRIINQKQTDVDISVIIPVYNTEQYVKASIESVLEQETKCKLEVLLIDDGSTDHSGDILEKFAANPAVRIIHQENRGFSGARNRGINEAHGKYLIFVDSDDLLEDGAIQTLFDCAEANQADIVSGGYRTFPEPLNEVRPKRESFSAEDISGKMRVTGFLCGKIFKRSLFQNVRLPLNLLFEDTILHLILLPLCGKMEVIPDILFAYRMHPNSISHSHSKSGKSLDAYWVVEELLKQREELGTKQDKILYRFLLFQLSFMTYVRTSFYEKAVQENLFYACCYLIEKYKIKGAELNMSQKLVEKAFDTKNYKLWTVCSRLNAYDNALSEF